LERCRQNPPLADKLYPGFVICLECGVLARRLVRSPKCHARRQHPEVDYPAKWPTAPLVGIGVAEADKIQHQAYIKNPSNRVVINAARRANYAGKLKAAEANPTSPEAAFINGERDRTARLNHERYWGAETDEGVRELEAAAKLDPTGTAAKKLADAAAFRESESTRRKARAPRDSQRNRERLEELAAAAEAHPDGPEAEFLKAKRRKQADEQREIRRLARAHQPFARGSTGRPKKTAEETRDFEIWQMVRNLIPRAAEALKALEELSPRERRNPEALKRRLLPLDFTLREIKQIPFSKPNAIILASHWVADSEGMDYTSVARARQRSRKRAA